MHETKLSLSYLHVYKVRLQQLSEHTQVHIVISDSLVIPQTHFTVYCSTMATNLELQKLQRSNGRPLYVSSSAYEKTREFSLGITNLLTRTRIWGYLCRYQVYIRAMTRDVRDTVYSTYGTFPSKPKVQVLSTEC